MALESLIKRIYDLPSIPKVVQDLIADLSAKSADASTISKNIQTDPVIAAKVLRLANSARYGAGRKIGSLDSAVVMLGTDTLKTLVIASGVTGTMKDIPGLDMRDFWRNSFLVANICKQIARSSTGNDPEVAFTCGMLHNIGIPLMCLAHEEEMKAIHDKLLEGGNRVALEKECFGFDNNEVSARLAEAWKFPQIIVEALVSQGANPDSTDMPFNAGVVQLASHINSQLGGDAELNTIVSELPESLVTKLNVNTFKLFEYLEVLVESEDDIDQMLAA